MNKVNAQQGTGHEYGIQKLIFQTAYWIRK